MQPTIYRIEFPDGQFYVGATVNFSERRRTHLRHSRKNKSVNAKLQSAFDTHRMCGIYEIASGFSRNSLHELERLVIAQWQPPLNVNRCPTPLPEKYSGKSKSWGPYACLRDAAACLGVSYVAVKKAAQRMSYDEYTAKLSARNPNARVGPPDPRKLSELIFVLGGWYRRKDVCKVSSSTAQARRRSGWGFEASHTVPAGGDNPILKKRSSKESICLRYGISYPTYYARRKLGWSLYEALGLRTRQQERKVSKVKKVVLTVNGKTRTLDGWAKDLGVSTGTLHGRRSAGWSDAQVVGLAPPPAKVKKQKRSDDEQMAREEQEQALLATGEPRWKLGLPFELDGETATLSEHCRRKGVTYALVRNRLLNGWPMDAAFDPPRRLTAGPRFVKGVEVCNQTC